MHPTATVRRARWDDLLYLPDIERAADGLFPKGRVPDSGETFPRSQLERALQDDLLLVAEVEGRVVGFAASAVVGDLLHLYVLAVHPAYGRRGLGTRLVHRVIEDARARGLAGVTLTTFADLPWNAPFYEKLGFRTLAPTEHTPLLASILAAEWDAGLQHRVAMLRPDPA